MMTHPTYEELNDWADGELPAAAGAHIAQHCSSCAKCTATAEGIRALSAAARALPRRMDPPFDVWGEIRRNTMATKPSRWDSAWQLRYPLAAAAIMIIGITALLTIQMVRSHPEQIIAVQKPSAVQLTMRKAEADYAQTVQTLEALLASRRATLDPATVKMLDQHLTLIDKAIRDAKSALVTHPDNPQLPHMITGAYERKVNMLTRALRSSTDI
jgi:hypothetical protein